MEQSGIKRSYYKNKNTETSEKNQKCKGKTYKSEIKGESYTTEQITKTGKRKDEIKSFFSVKRILFHSNKCISFRGQSRNTKQ